VTGLAQHWQEGPGRIGKQAARGRLELSELNNIPAIRYPADRPNGTKAQ
jgi:hypothetical protein